MPAKKMNVDFSKVKDGGNFNKKRIPAGDYLATITKVEDAPSKKDNIDQLLFSVKIDKHPSSVLPYYCKIQENQLWKLRNIFIAAGKTVPKRRISVDPNSIVGKKIGVTIEDTEYEDKDQSEIGGVFPASELDDAPDTSDDEVDLDGDDEDEDTSIDDEPEAEAEDEPEEEEAEEAEEPEEEEEAEEEREGMDRTAIKKAIRALDGKAGFKASESDDDLYARLVVLRSADAEDEVEEAPAPKKKAAPAKKAPAKKKPTDEVSDDELEDIDIDDI